MTHAHVWRTALATAATTAIALAIAAPSQAKSDNSAVVTMDYYGGKFYDNAVTEESPDYVVFAGAPMEDFCAHLGDESRIGTLHIKGDGDTNVAGSTDRYWTTLTVPVIVFEYEEGGVFELLTEYCAPGGELMPFATGDAVLKVRGTTEYLGGGDYLRYEENSLRGSLRTSDGTAVPIHTYAAFSNFGPPEEVSVSVGGPAAG